MRRGRTCRTLVLGLAAAGTAALAPAVVLGGTGGGRRTRGDGRDGASAGARRAATHTVTLQDIAFHPGDLRIARGDSVTWVWHDGENEHNVTFHGFHSRTQTHGSYTVRFARRGTFSYECTLHVAEGMKGEIVVR
jgi:plastocyanin